MRFSNHFLGGEALRRERFARILAQADAAAPEPTSPAFVFPDLPPPSAPSLAVGNAIRLADSVRIFEQYARTLARGYREPSSPIGQFLSFGLAGDTLKWFDRLNRDATYSPAMVSVFRRQLDMYAPEPNLPVEQQYYTMLRELPFPDLQLARLLVNLALPGAKEYHAHVARNLAGEGLPWDEFRNRVEGWRDAGLLHPLLLAARHMPTLNDWLPVEMHEEAGAWADILTRLNGARDSAGFSAALEGIDTRVDWGGRAGLAIAAILDSLAIRMRLLSHKCEPLDQSIADFPDLDACTTPQMWKRMSQTLEKHVPPSALCPRLTGFKQATWGYERLTPVWDGRCLRFAEQTMTWVEPQPGPRAAPPQRLPEVLARMGVVALSREFGYLMNLAIDGCDFIARGETTITDNERQTCETPELLLHFMRKPELLSEDRDVEDMILTLFSSLPGVRCEEKPVQLAAWRVSPPPRVVLARNMILDERSSAEPVGRIITGDTGLHASLRSELRTRMREPVVETTRREARCTSTVLHEAVLEFGRGPPPLHTRLRLHDSNPWSNEHEDRRYAETQVAANGHRFRDWLAVHPEAKCRLESHTISVDRVFYTFFPLQDKTGCHEWVKVASSVRPDLRVLHCRNNGNQPVDRLATGVKARFLQV